MDIPGSCLYRWFANLLLDLAFGKPDLEDYSSSTLPNPKPNV